MRSRTLRLYILVVAITFLGVSCRQNLLRYGNRSTCLGYSNVFVFSFDLPNAVPASTSSARMAVVWDKSSAAFVLRDKHGLLHLINNAGRLDVEQINADPWQRSTKLALAEKFDLAAVTVGTSDSSTVYIYSLKVESPTNPYAKIDRTWLPEWHPDQLLFAGIYFPEGYQHASNVLGVFDLQGQEPVLSRTYELNNTAINDVFGWSHTGEVIAVSQDSQKGAIPYYIFSQNGEIERSLFSTANHSCVADGQWAPDKQIFAFSGVNETMEGWDIFLETVTPAEDVDRSLVNLTDSPREDELGAAWSPNGEQIAYSKTYEDVRGHFRQELFLIHLNDDAHRSVQLTDTADDYETDPTWISDREIAYLSWNPVEGSWSLNILSTSEATPASGRLMEIPPSWYWDPQVDSDR